MSASATPSSTATDTHRFADAAGAIDNRFAEEARATTQSILTELSRVIVGQQQLLDRLVLGLLADGHILLEGLPGLAKTLAVRTLAATITGECRRVQFTPDLLPTDLSGTMIYNQRTGEFAVQRGPIFANVLLADEINRAPAKVQSALLEAMQERQVTIGGESLALPPLFLVLATQNPIEHDGTYPLPEAQVDRFMFKLLVGYPERGDERVILDRMGDADEPVAQPVVDVATLLRVRASVPRVYADARIKEYVLDIINATRTPASFGLGDLTPYIEFGSSPRGSLYVVRAAKAQALLQGRGYVTPDDIQSLAHDVLRHRLVLTYRAEAEGVTADRIIDRILASVPAP